MLGRICAFYDGLPDDSLRFVRDEDFIKHLLRHPGVNQEGILVCESEGEINGLAVVAIIGDEDYKHGNIIELQAMTAVAADTLLQSAFDYSVTQGVDIVEVRPLAGEAAQRVFNRRKWLKIEGGVMMIKPLCLAPFISALAGSIRTETRGIDDIKLVLRFEDEIVEVDTAARPVGAIRLDCVPAGASLIVDMTAKKFIEIVFGLANPYKAYLRRDVKISGIRHVWPFLRFLASIKTTPPVANIVDGR